MKILYIGVHSHTGWGAEYWLKKSFSNLNIEQELIDYRDIRKKSGVKILKDIIDKKSSKCDMVFLQRADNINPSLFKNTKIPIIFWSTEPIQLKSDVDQLLNSNIFSWVYVHSYSCLDKIINKFSHLIDKTSVMHNAAPKEIIQKITDKNRFAIFNRNLSWRRKLWLFPSRNLYDNINGNYGEKYFKDLQESQVSINIHYSKKNLDDFESGIFEGMASGCAIISEKLNNQTLIDLNLEDTIIQFNNPRELKQKLIKLKNNPNLVKHYQKKSYEGIQKNTWDNRAFFLLKKFNKICNGKR